MFVGYIYMIRNKKNNKKYIGQTTRNLEIRWKEHKEALLENKHNDYFQNAWNKHGENNFEFRMIVKVETKFKNDLYDRLNSLEKEYIKHFHSMYNEYGYNLREGGDNSPVSEYTKKKLSIANSGERNGFYGKKHSLKSRKKIKLARRKQKLSKEAYRKSSESQSGEKNHFYRKTHSIETKELIINKNQIFRKKKLEENIEKIIEAYLRINRGERKYLLAKELEIDGQILNKIEDKIGLYGEIINEHLDNNLYENDTYIKIYNKLKNQNKKRSLFNLKLNIIQIIDIYKLSLTHNLNSKDIAKIFNTNYQAINCIKSKTGFYGEIINMYLEELK